jgi:hypothetical protein
MKQSFVRFQLSEALAAELLERSERGQLTSQDLRHQVAIGRFSKETLKQLNIADNVLVTSVKMLVKAMEKHDLTPSMVASLPALIQKPVACYTSDTERNSVVVVTVESPDGKNPILVPFRVDVPDAANKPNMHWMVSAYCKDDPEIFDRWEKKGLLIWRQPEQIVVAKEIVASATVIQNGAVEHIEIESTGVVEIESGDAKDRNAAPK